MAGGAAGAQGSNTLGTPSTGAATPGMQQPQGSGVGQLAQQGPTGGLGGMLGAVGSLGGQSNLLGQLGQATAGGQTPPNPFLGQGMPQQSPGFGPGVNNFAPPGSTGPGAMPQGTAYQQLAMGMPAYQQLVGNMPLDQQSFSANLGKVAPGTDVNAMYKNYLNAYNQNRNINPYTLQPPQPMGQPAPMGQQLNPQRAMMTPDMQKMQELTQQMQTYQQSNPIYQQMQQLQGSFGPNNMPNQQQVEQMQQLSQQFNQDPRMLAFQAQADALKQQQMNALGQPQVMPAYPGAQLPPNIQQLLGSPQRGFPPQGMPQRGFPQPGMPQKGFPGPRPMPLPQQGGAGARTPLQGLGGLQQLMAKNQQYK